MHRLLIVSQYFWPEDFIINELAAELVKRGFLVTVLCFQPSYPRGRLFRGYRNRLFSRGSWRGVEILRFKTIPGYRESLAAKLFMYLWFALFGSLVALLAPLRFDLVFVYQVGPLTAAVPGIAAGKSRRRPVVVYTQDVWPDAVYAYGFRKTTFLSASLDAFVRWVYASADAILISCSGFEKVLRKYTAKPMLYAPNWPLSRYMPCSSSATEQDRPIFLFAGNVGKVQNLENVLRGYAIAVREDKDIGRLRIVGDGSALQDLKQLAGHLDIRVEFPGRVHPERMSEEYDKASFLVLSLAAEPVLRLTVPSKFQMYLTVAKPILCAAGGEVAERVASLDLGITAAASDPASIARAFLAMKSSDERTRQRWAQNARSASENEFSKQRIIAEIERLLLSCIGEA